MYGVGCLFLGLSENKPAASLTNPKKEVVMYQSSN